MPGVLQSERLVRQLIEQQVAQGIAANRIVLAGFSQGGVMSLFTGLRYPEALAGIMALSCYLPGGEQLPEDVSSANRDTPILQCHGEQDDVVASVPGLWLKRRSSSGDIGLNGTLSQWRTAWYRRSLISSVSGCRRV